MKNWLKEHRTKILISTLVTLLPMLIGLLLWNQLPDNMASHWGADGAPDGSASKAFMVFGMPLLLEALNLVCIAVTAADPKQKNQNKKALGLIFWIMPLGSLASCGMVYAAALGRAMDAALFVPLLLGILFAVMGNYMPKVTQNSTLGVKIFWTLYNEENWNKTHRFTGKVWVAGGVVALLLALLPMNWMLPLLLLDILVITATPVIYSYRIYRNHKAQGIEYVAPPKTKSQKTTRILVLALIVALLCSVAAFMFTGDITYTCTDSALRIETSYVAGLELPYGDMDSIELLESYEVGMRVNGFASARLSMGAFQNDDFELYTLYSYNACESVILIRSGNKALVINAKTAEETTALYETLLAKIG